jgi:hypothetical protein
MGTGDDLVPEALSIGAGERRRSPELAQVLADTHIVARRVLGDLVREAIEEGDLWSSYPEIGENDWNVVLDQLQHLVTAVPRDIHDAAYARLEARATSMGSVPPRSAPLDRVILCEGLG